MISTYILPSVLAFIMFGMGLSLTAQDFRNIALHPRAIFIGLVCQMILLPIIAILIAYIAGIAGLSPELQVGIVLIAACPGGAVSNLITYLLKANVALSVSLTTINSFLVIFSIPITIKIALFLFLEAGQTEINLPFWDTLFQILLMTVIPCVLGIYIQSRSPRLANTVEQPLKYLMPVLLALAMLGAIFLENGDANTVSVLDYTEVALFVLILNISGMSLGYYAAKSQKLDKNNQITIAIEVGLQNTGLAITIATSQLFLGSQIMAIPASIYALFTFFSAVIFGLWVKPELIRSLLKFKTSK